MAALLLMHIKNEESVFWCMLSLFGKYNWREIYNDNMPKLKSML